MKKSVFILDSEMIFAEGLKCLFEKQGELEVKGISTSGIESLKAIKNLKPDIVIMDCKINDISEIDAIEKLHSENVGIKIIFLTSEFDVNQAVKAMNSNVDGYILKNISFEEFYDIVVSVLNGTQYIDSSVINSINRYLAENDNNNNVELTHREIEILEMIVSGSLNKEIAAALNISERTVKNHVSSLFKKIKVSDRTQAAVYAIKNNIVNI